MSRTIFLVDEAKDAAEGHDVDVDCLKTERSSKLTKC